MREVEAARFRRDEVVLRDGDQLGPAPVAHGGVGVEEEAEDFVADLVAADVGAELLDDAGEIAAEDDRELVRGHLLQSAGGDEDVDGLTEDACTRTSSSLPAARGSGMSSRRAG